MSRDGVPDGVSVHSASERAGFWRRAGSLVADSLIVAVALQVIALAAFPLSGGLVHATGALRQTACRQITSTPMGIDVPAEFAANFALDCSFGLFGLTTARTLTVGRSAQEGSVHKTVSVTFMLDREGRPVSGLSLDLLFSPILLAMRWLFDRRGRSPGRRLVAIRIASRGDDPDCPPERPRRVDRRYLLFAAPLVPAWLAQLWTGLDPHLGFHMIASNSVAAVFVAVFLIAAAPGLSAAVAIARRRDAYYDRLAGTQVVRTGPS